MPGEGVIAGTGRATDHGIMGAAQAFLGRIGREPSTLLLSGAIGSGAAPEHMPTAIHASRAAPCAVARITTMCNSAS